MKLTQRVLRGALVPLAVLLAALVIAACGGSSGSGGSSAKKTASTTTSKGKASATETAFTTCLKQHGVTLPKRFGQGFGGFRRGTGTGATGTDTVPTGATGTTGTAPSGGFPGAGAAGAGAAHRFAGGNSKLAKAIKACDSKLGRSGFGAGGFARGHFGGTGTGHFTPHFTAATLKSYVACIRKNGYPAMPEPKAGSNGTDAFPASVQKNAKFVKANAKCESLLFKGFKRPTPSGQTTTSTGATTSTTANT